MRVTLLVASNDAVRSGTNDNAVSATVVRTNVDRGCRARRLSTRAMSTPTATHITVTWAKPRTGMASPGDVSKDTPAAPATEATATVAAAAAAPEATPRRHSAGRLEVVVFVNIVELVVGLSVAVMGSSSGAGRLFRPSLRLRTDPRESTRQSKKATRIFRT